VNISKICFMIGLKMFKGKHLEKKTGFYWEFFNFGYLLLWVLYNVKLPFDSILDSVHTVSDKFSYIVYKAFLKYLYTGTIDLPSENALGNWNCKRKLPQTYNSETELTLQLIELADMYCETNLKKDYSQIIKQAITVSNITFFYNKVIEHNAKYYSSGLIAINVVIH